MIQGQEGALRRVAPFSVFFVELANVAGEDCGMNKGRLSSNVSELRKPVNTSRAQYK